LLTVSPEERETIRDFSGRAAMTGEVTFFPADSALMRNVLVQSVSTDGRKGALFLSAESWKSWCEGMLGTAQLAGVNAFLLADMTAAVLRPLSDAAAVMPDGPLCLNPATFLSGQLVMMADWTVEGYAFRAAITGPAVAALQEKRPQPESHGLSGEADAHVRLPVYAGGAVLPLRDIGQLSPGDGVFFSPFTDLCSRQFLVGFPDGKAAELYHYQEEYWTVETVAENLSDYMTGYNDDGQSPSSAALVLDEIPQMLLVELGQATLSLKESMTIQEGDILPATVSFTPEVTLRLNGRTAGYGELVLCESRFLVRIKRWLLVTSEKSGIACEPG